MINLGNSFETNKNIAPDLCVCQQTTGNSWERGVSEDQTQAYSGPYEKRITDQNLAVWRTSPKD